MAQKREDASQRRFWEKKNYSVKAPMFCLSISEAGRKTIIIKKKKKLKQWSPGRESKTELNRNVNEWTESRILLVEKKGRPLPVTQSPLTRL